MTTPHLPTDRTPVDPATGATLPIIGYAFIVDGRLVRMTDHDDAMAVAEWHGVEHVFPIVDYRRRTPPIR